MMEMSTKHTHGDQAAMNFIFSNFGRPGSAIDLAAGQCWRVSGDSCRQAIICQEGQVWITQPHDVKDYILEKGQAFMITLPGQVLVQALTFSRIAYVENLRPEALKNCARQLFFK